jgi:S-formylglutathione hydrolase FrmB
MPVITGVATPGQTAFSEKTPLFFLHFVSELPFDFTYSEGPGDHTWGHWDEQIQNVLEWLPLQKR